MHYRAGDSGAIVALQIRRLENNAEINVFSKRAELGCPPCEMPLVLSGAVAQWEELIRGLRTRPFYEKRNINIHLNTEVTSSSVMLAQHLCTVLRECSSQ
jgi:NADPH-dependent 2,4-dienoyl-CoA reductase/sulfur reductase-like enzyme